MCVYIYIYFRIQPIFRTICNVIQISWGRCCRLLPSISTSRIRTCRCKSQRQNMLTLWKIAWRIYVYCNIQYIPICIIYINIIYIYNLHIIIDNYSRYGMYMNVYPYSRFFPWTFVSILGLFPFPPGPLTWCPERPAQFAAGFIGGWPTEMGIPTSSRLVCWKCVLQNIPK